MQKMQPKLLILLGRHHLSFDSSEPELLGPQKWRRNLLSQFHLWRIPQDSSGVIGQSEVLCHRWPQVRKTCR